MLTSGAEESLDDERAKCLRAQRLVEGIGALAPDQAADVFRYADSLGLWTD
jgi:hypothetical protein